MRGTHSFSSTKIPGTRDTALNAEHAHRRMHMPVLKSIHCLLFTQNPNACSNINKYHKNQKCSNSQCKKAVVYACAHRGKCMDLDKQVRSQIWFHTKSSFENLSVHQDLGSGSCWVSHCSNTHLGTAGYGGGLISLLALIPPASGWIT